MTLILINDNVGVTYISTFLFKRHDFYVCVFSYVCCSLPWVNPDWMMLQLCTVPLDTAKVRLQLQRKIPTGDGDNLPKYRGSLGTLSTIAREEGISGLWKGVIAGLHRQCIYGGLRIGLYEPVSLTLLLLVLCTLLLMTISITRSRHFWLEVTLLGIFHYIRRSLQLC